MINITLRRRQFFIRFHLTDKKVIKSHSKIFLLSPPHKNSTNQLNKIAFNTNKIRREGNFDSDFSPFFFCKDKNHLPRISSDDFIKTCKPCRVVEALPAECGVASTCKLIPKPSNDIKVESKLTEK